MAKLNVKPPKRRRKGEPTPPVESDSTRNLEKKNTGERENLNLKVPAEFKREFKAYCGENGFSMVWFLQEAYKRHKDEFRR